MISAPAGVALGLVQAALGQQEAGEVAVVDSIFRVAEYPTQSPAGTSARPGRPAGVLRDDGELVAGPAAPARSCSRS
ncbi:MAG: hypothetical protein H6647_19965 [Anaerolineales bacterium]|nr:hypothetical protein [Anaerolineales bacterium]